MKPQAGEIWEVSCDALCHDLVLMVSESAAYFLECSAGNVDNWDYGRFGDMGAYTFIRRIQEAA